MRYARSVGGIRVKPLGAVTLLFLLAALPAAAGAELELVDGRVLVGTEVERQGRLYLLRINEHRNRCLWNIPKSICTKPDKCDYANCGNEHCFVDLCWHGKCKRRPPRKH